MSPPLTPHIGALFSFCNAPLAYPAVRQRCLEMGWHLDEDDPGQLVLRVEFDDRVSPLVASLGPDQPFGRAIYLPLFFTDDSYDCVTGAEPESRPEFNIAFARARSLFENELGTPAASGTFDFFGGTYQFAAWRGSHAALALIQDDYDIQFGSEISMWILECASGAPLPSLPPHS